MKIKIIKPHHVYKGTVNLTKGEANYLLRVGVAEEVKEKAKEDKKTGKKSSKK